MICGGSVTSTSSCIRHSCCIHLVVVVIISLLLLLLSSYSSSFHQATSDIIITAVSSFRIRWILTTRSTPSSTTRSTIFNQRSCYFKNSITQKKISPSFGSCCTSCTLQQCTIHRRLSLLSSLTQSMPDDDKNFNRNMSTPITTTTTTTTTTTSTISSSSSSSSSSPFVPTTNILPGNPSWQQTMIRIRDPKASLYFYCTVLQMTHIDTFHFPQYQFSIYFIATLPHEHVPYRYTPGTAEAHDFVWNYSGTTLELTHNHGTELPILTNNDDDTGTDNSDTTTTTTTTTNLNRFTGYHPGNDGPNDGFGHIAILVNDVYETCHILENEYQCTFPKKPNEGRMKGLAFVHDPDKYWIEILPRGPQLLQQPQPQQSLTSSSSEAAVAVKSTPTTIDCNLSQTMLRIKDPAKSIPFYLSFGMKLLKVRHFDTFSLYFLGSGNISMDDENDNNDDIELNNRFHPVLELTHNHGTEQDDTFRHYNGNEPNRCGFGHLGFLVDDVYETCTAIIKQQQQNPNTYYGFRKKPEDGTMKGLAFCYDPDGYSIEIIKRGGMDYGDVFPMVG